MPFCGHATIATAVALAEREPADEMIFHTQAGPVSINTEQTSAGSVAELTSVAPRWRRRPTGPGARRACDALHWSDGRPRSRLPAVVANAGAQHLILVTRTHERLADLDYDFDALAALMQQHEPDHLCS